MTADLASRLLEAIEETERDVRESPEWPQWNIPPSRLGQRIAAVLRRCAADREQITDVLGWTHDYDDDNPYISCAQAVVHWDPDAQTPGDGCDDSDRAGGPCDCASGARRQRILKRLAAGYGLTTEEQP